MIKPRNLRAIDLFCGAGGTTEGAQQSGFVEVTAAINHWRVAVQSHRENHPKTRHICAEIDQVDPRDFADSGTDLLLASPECIFHSNARGGQPVDDQRRATAWCVPRWAEVLLPKWIIVENVREFVDWGPLGADRRPLKSKRGEIFKAWIASLAALNYHVEWRFLNAADYGGATKRTRLFVVCRRGRSRQPIPWPAPTHAKEHWTPAWRIIDWSRQCPSIFHRKRPLADKTLRRIEIGLRKFCGAAAEPFIVKLRRNMNAGSIDDPLSTITAGAEHQALALPFQFKAMGRKPGATKPITDPLPTILAAKANHAIVTPFVVNYHGGPDATNRNSSIDEPLPVIDTNPRHAVAVPYLVDVNHGDDRRSGGRAHGIEKPLGTVTGKRGQAIVKPFIVPNFGERSGQEPRTHGVESPLPTVTGHGAGALVLPFLTSYFSNGKPQSVDEPLSTVTTKHRHGLAMVELLKAMEELHIVDIGFRMLDVDELARAQGFPDGYQLFGTKAEQIKQIGNSVHTAVARELCRAIALAG